MIALGDERDLRHHRISARHLTDDAQFVDDGVTRLDASVDTLIDEQLLRKGIAAGIEHFDRHCGAGVARRGIEQRLEPRVFDLQQRRRFHRRRLCDQRFLQT